MTTARKPRRSPRAILDGQVSESQLQRDVLKEAHLRGWLCFHVYDSRLASAGYVDAGFPDAILVRAGRVLACEFKTMRGKVSQAQSRWLLELAYLGRVECYIWRPDDLSSGEIERVLAGAPKTSQVA